MIQFSWENKTLSQSFLEFLAVRNSRGDQLCKILESSEAGALETDWHPVNESIAYLTKFNHKALEKKVSQVFKHIDQLQLDRLLKSLTRVSLESGRLKMLDTCQKVIQLESIMKLSSSSHLKALISSEALLVPEHKTNLTLLAKSFSHHVKLSSHRLARMIHYITSTLSKGYFIDFSHVPKSEYEAGAHLGRWRSLSIDVFHISRFLIDVFASAYKAAAVGLSCLGALVGIKFVFDKLKLGRPETINSFYFRNLNTEALKNPDLKKTYGRASEISKLEIALSARAGQLRCIPILVGPPGVGKTQLLEGLALKIEEKKTRFLNDKKILAVNSTALTNCPPSFEKGELVTRLESIFSQLQGHEHEFILFFDEAHNLASLEADGTPKPGCVLQALKDKLLSVPVQCVFATTTEEFNKLIAPDKAFVSRLLKIDVEPMSEAETKMLLIEKYGNQTELTIEQGVFDQVIDCASKRQESNPRKSENILIHARNYLNAWTPRVLSEQEQRLDAKYRQKEASAREKFQHNPHWIVSDEAATFLHELTLLKDEKKRLKEKINLQTNIILDIDRLSHLIKIYTLKFHDLIHLLDQKFHSLDQKALELAQKQYLFLKHILLGELKTLRSEKQKTLHTDYKEQMPLAITKELIENLQQVQVLDA